METSSEMVILYLVSYSIGDAANAGSIPIGRLIKNPIKAPKVKKLKFLSPAKKTN